MAQKQILTGAVQMSLATVPAVAIQNQPGKMRARINSVYVSQMMVILIMPGFIHQVRLRARLHRVWKIVTQK